MKQLVIGVLGVGNIFQHYLKALNYVPEVRIKSVFDTTEKDVDGSLHFCKDMRDILKDPEIDAVLVSTPPGTHFGLAKKVLMAKKDVILEKPPVEKASQLRDLGGIANTFGKKVFASFHAAYCLALRQLLRSMEVTDKGTFHPKFGMLKMVSSNFYDPYVIKGRLKDEINLGGSWIDSGPNALSVLLLLVNDVKIVRAKFDVPIYFGKNCREVEGNVSFNFPGGTGIIYTNWENYKQSKITNLLFEKGEIIIHHTDESLYDGNSKLLKSFKETGTERLTHQYIGVFSDIARMIHSGENNFGFAMKVMAVLEDAYNKGEVVI